MGVVIARTEKGHEILMARAIDLLQQQGISLPSEVDPLWLTLGNVRTDVPNITADHRTPIQSILRLIVEGFLCSKADHPRHAMRCKNQPVVDAYQHMLRILQQRFEDGCDASTTWEERALSFGSGLHTLQDSYCIAHTMRIDNGDPHAAIIDMHTWPSREHPFTTKKDSPWQDKAKTALREDAAAAVTATVAALKIFVAQDTSLLPAFFEQYVSFREDIALQRHPEHRTEVMTA